MTPPTGPLHGIRVIELARILAGPWIGQTLADLGADVIKIEAPTGDDTRVWGPPFVKNADGSDGDAAYFTSCNRGKRSIVLDLATPKGQAAAVKLATDADVLIENFKVGGLAKYGLDYSELSAVNPGLIYCAVTGFGQDGPYAPRAGYDYMIQAMSGIMDLTGEPDGDPQKIGVAFVDLFTGLYGVIAIQAALRAREASGLGQFIDMALYDSMVAVLANQNMNYLISGTPPRRLGNAHPNIVPYQVFKVSDGDIVIAVGNDGQFGRLCELLGCAELAAQPDYLTNRARVQNRQVLIDELASRIAHWSRDKLLAALEKTGVPAGPINTLADVHTDPQLAHRQLVKPLIADWTAAGSIPTVSNPIKFSSSQIVTEKAPPRLGQHTAEITQEFGLDL
jgi:crotonobetainyl-CoA:carnitine CoA-transferase CaiB-like acyl-CoA transferase